MKTYSEWLTEGAMRDQFSGKMNDELGQIKKQIADLESQIAPLQKRERDIKRKLDMASHVPALVQGNMKTYRGERTGALQHPMYASHPHDPHEEWKSKQWKRAKYDGYSNPQFAQWAYKIDHAPGDDVVDLPLDWTPEMLSGFEREYARGGNDYNITFDGRRVYIGDD